MVTVISPTSTALRASEDEIPPNAYHEDGALSITHLSQSHQCAVLKVDKQHTIELGAALSRVGSCSAAAAVAHRIGLCDRDITVHMPGRSPYIDDGLLSHDWPRPAWRV